MMNKEKIKNNTRITEFKEHIANLSILDTEFKRFRDLLTDAERSASVISTLNAEFNVMFDEEMIKASRCSKTDQAYAYHMGRAALLHDIMTGTKQKDVI